ncbi:hypothetical protein HanIR_Chr05g0251541 [Helianthus annuus]|nr:hypothetical protein HanIR_Chr05g0251541 [Helianthus annuus]
MTCIPCLETFSKKKKKKKKKKKLDVPLSTLKFYLLHFNPFEVFTFNSNFFLLL